MWGAIGAIGASIVGAYSQSQTNSANAAIAQASNTSNLDMFNAANRFNQQEASYGREFNSAEAARARDWSESQGQIARDWSSNSQAESERFNSSEAQKNRDWQQQMSETSWQRAVGDMKNAGLNPMLAYSQGGASSGSGSAASVAAQSASAPGGSTASSGSASSAAPPRSNVPAYQAPTGAALSSGLSVLRQAQELDIMKATEDKIKSETQQTELDTKFSKATFEERWRGINWDTENKQRQGRLLDLKQKVDEAELKKRNNEISLFDYDRRMRAADATLTELGIPKAKAEGEFFEGIGSYGPYVKMISGGLSSAVSAGRALKGLGTRNVSGPVGGRSYSDTFYDKHGDVSGGRSRTYAND